MFVRLSTFTTRHWLAVILAWLTLLVIVRVAAPRWDAVTFDGDFAFLPDDMPSVVGEALTEAAFPDFQAKSQIVLVLARPAAPLTDDDLLVADRLARRFHHLLGVASFARGTALEQQAAAARDPEQRRLLTRQAERSLATAQQAFDEALRLDERMAWAWHSRGLLHKHLGLVADAERDFARAVELDPALQGISQPLPADAVELPLVDVWSPRHEVFGSKLISSDQQAVLVVLQLRTEFMATENLPLLNLVHETLESTRRQLEQQGIEGLVLGVSGSAAVGGDMLVSAAESIENTELFTILLVVGILLLVYRAPLLVLVPLITIAVSLVVALGVVAALTQVHLLPGFDWWTFKVFKTTRIFIVVILFGAGTDFCLFLIARFREELRRVGDEGRATAAAVVGVGDALVASALTTILGLATMFFAEFGKFRNSGPAIGICLTIALLACLTLAPAVLAALGRAVFWPWGTAAAATHRPWRLWNSLSRIIVARPGRILITCTLLLLPLAAIGWFTADHVTFDLLGELDASRPSIRGSKVLERHFPVGESGPVIVLMRKPDAGFGTEEKGPAALAGIFELTQELAKIEGVTAVRSLAEPLGDPPRRISLLSSAGRRKLFLREHQLTKSIFLAQSPTHEGEVTRFELVLDADPFSREALQILNRIEYRLQQLRAARGTFWSEAEFSFTGTTAAIRDLRRVTRGDQQRIQILVVLAVLGVLWMILRHLPICLYLIASVVFSYLVTIGATGLFFAWAYGDTFQGLDWKVPVFLFVILVAVGEDYNIYLVTRVFEEQARLGPFAGLRQAIVETGGIITSCGIIMAGTFVSMTSGSLRGIVELGFALSLGVLLDTFVVRTVLVPAFLALWCRWTSRGLEP